MGRHYKSAGSTWLVLEKKHWTTHPQPCLTPLSSLGSVKPAPVHV